MRIKFEQIYKTVAPQFHVIVVEAKIQNPPTPPQLWDEITDAAQWLRENFEISQLNKRSAILATRKVYKSLGKDPNRYRPSAEALSRRLVKGLDLYRTLTAIDLINLISIKTGCSIGGFDADKICGDTLCLGVGREGEEFDAIGRGPLNIAGLPVYRDNIGGIGTPTSDHERTKLDLKTSNLLMLINVYDSDCDDNDIIELAKKLLTQYSSATDINIRIIQP